MLSAASNFSICSFTCTSSRADLLSYPNSDSCFHLLRINARDAVGNSCSNLYWWWSGPSCGFVMHIDSNKHIYIYVCVIFTRSYIQMYRSSSSKVLRSAMDTMTPLEGPCFQYGRTTAGLEHLCFITNCNGEERFDFFFQFSFLLLPFFGEKALY